MAEKQITKWCKPMNYPLVVESDLNDDLQTETLDAVFSVLVRCIGNLEFSTKSLKEDMYKKTGQGWNVIAGENFSHSVTYTKNMIFVYFRGNTGLLMWK